MAASNVNVVVITGNLTKDPELRYTGGGTAVCELRVAVNSRRKDGQSGQWVDKPNYFDVTVWGAQGENCANYLVKGRPVAVEGRLDWREWEAKDGSGKRQAVQIVANTVQFLGPKPEAAVEAAAELPLDTSDFEGAAVAPAGAQAVYDLSDEQLMAEKRPELDRLAVEAGVDDPGDYTVKQDVVDAIRERERSFEAPVAAGFGGEDDIPF